MRFVLSIFAAFLAYAPRASAQIWNSPRNPVTCNLSGQYCNFCDALKVTVNIIDFVTIMAFPLALAVIVYGGIRMMIAAGDESNYKSGVDAIKSAVIGLVIVMASWLIVTEISHLIGGGSAFDPWSPLTCE
jgi:hypothetical protein